MSHSQHSPSAHLRSQRALDEQISFVLAHPGMSVWLKNALSTALDRDPIAILNELEVLTQILRTRSELLIAENSASETMHEPFAGSVFCQK